MTNTKTNSNTVLARINFRQAGTGEVLDSVDINVPPDQVSGAVRKVLQQKLRGEWLIDVGDSITVDELSRPA